MPARTPPPQPSPRRLATYLRQAARAAGYDIDTPRSGAIKQLSADSGIPQSTLSRTFAGETIPDIRHLQALADTLHVDVVDLLVEAGLITRPDDPTAESTPRTFTPSVPSPHTPEDAAIALGIPPEDRALFTSLAKRLMKDQGGTTD